MKTGPSIHVQPARMTEGADFVPLTPGFDAPRAAAVVFG